MDKEQIGSRIQELINDLNMNVTSFSKHIGLKNNVTLGKIIKGVNYPSFDVVYAIMYHLPKLNARWLILNKGAKYNDTNDRYEIDRLKQDVMDLKEAFKSVKKYNDTLIDALAKEKSGVSRQQKA